MSNTRRPATGRKQTARTAAAAKREADEALETGVSLTVDGTTYTVRLGSLSARDTMALRRATGLSVRALIADLQRDPDIDLIAALVWLGRRTGNDGATAPEPLLEFDEVAEEIAYDSDFDLEGLDADTPGDADPEA